MTDLREPQTEYYRAEGDDSLPETERLDVGHGFDMPVDSDYADPVWSCRRKKVYPSQQAAERAANAITELMIDGRVQAYGCRHCGSWHLGGAPGARAATVGERPKPVRRRASSTHEGYASPRRRLRRERHHRGEAEEDG